MTDEVIGEVSQGAATPAAPEVHQGEVPQNPEQAPETTQADTAEQPDEEHKVPKGVQKRIDRLTRERYQLKGELEAMRRMAVQQPAPQAQQSAAEGAPKAEQFSTYEEFLEAKAEWKAEQKVAEVLRKQQESTQRQSAEAERQKVAQAWESRVEAASDAYDDFEEVALSPDLPVSAPMAEAIKRAEKGADVLYYLGKNPEIAGQIARLDPLSAAIRIGEIAATLARPVAKKATSAPPPINPVGARASTAKDPSKMTDAEFAAWRREQIKRR